jgi:hypothetical protein
MRFWPKDIEELRYCLSGQLGKRRVEADANTGIEAKTVDELRALATWPNGLVVTTPSEDQPDVRISRVSLFSS